MHLLDECFEHPSRSARGWDAIKPITGLSDADQRLIVRGVEHAEERGMDVLNEVVRAAGEFGIDVSTEMLYGDPVREITDYAQEAGFDTIYVGQWGRSERATGYLGSVARDIVERATVPVPVVR